MAITRGATTSISRTSVTGTNAGVSSHTVDVGTTLLVYTFFNNGNISLTSTPQWSLGGGEDLTLVSANPVTGTGDVRMETWALVNPTDGAGAITASMDSNDNFYASAVNYLATETSSVANAIKLVDEDIDNTGSRGTTLNFTSGGDSGNTLYGAGCGFGGNGIGGSPTPEDFLEIVDHQSGTSQTADTSVFVVDYVGGAPSSLTWTFTTTDEMAGHMLEIVEPSASSIIPQAMHHYRQRRD